MEKYGVQAHNNLRSYYWPKWKQKIMAEKSGCYSKT